MSTEEDNIRKHLREYDETINRLAEKKATKLMEDFAYYAVNVMGEGVPAGLAKGISNALCAMPDSLEVKLANILIDSLKRYANMAKVDENNKEVVEFIKSNLVD